MSPRIHRSIEDQGGFSLIEMLVSVTIMLAVTAGIFSVMNPAHGTFQAQPELSDMQQRLRVGADTLYKDILMAGAGSYMGTASGSLGNYFAPILPYKQGANAALDDGAGVFHSDSITLMYIPTTAVQTTIASAMPNESAELKVNPAPGCPPSNELCGFYEGLTVLIYDETGAYDTMVITEVQTSALHLQHNLQGPLSKAYQPIPPTKISQVSQHVYYLDTTTDQLKHYDGTLTGVGVPVVDNVVALNFDYYGDPVPPTLKKPGTDQSITYGPKPPDLGVSSGTSYGDGANCIIEVVAGVQQSRLPTLAGSGLVKLTAATLTDGPWCPDPGNVNRWDADLLRVRRISVTMRLQAAVSELRGTGSLFLRPGTAKRSNQTLPDQEIKFDVIPRNLNLGR